MAQRQCTRCTRKVTGRAYKRVTVSRPSARAPYRQRVQIRHLCEDCGDALEVFLARAAGVMTHAPDQRLRQPMAWRPMMAGEGAAWNALREIALGYTGPYGHTAQTYARGFIDYFGPLHVQASLRGARSASEDT